MRVLIALLLMMSPAFAQDKDICAHLTAHTPRADVAHVPGAENVVPADIGGGLDASSGELEIPIEINLSKMTGNADVPDDLQVATLTVVPNGQVMFNGQDISDSLREACALKKQDTEHGQPTEKPVLSQPENNDTIQGQYPDNEQPENE